MIYRLLFRLVVQRIDAERAHRVSLRALRVLTGTSAVRRALRRLLGPKDPALEVQVWGRTFPSPLGLAAGMDKEATAFDGFGALGFGFVEVGTVTPRPQEGSPRPRVCRLPGERAVLNRMGFPNPGAVAIGERLRGRSGETLVGANVGRARDTPSESAGADYRAAVRELAPHCDYVVVNVSSPNTPGLRDLQAIETLRALIADVRAELREIEVAVPLLVKISPDLADEEVDAIADLALELALDGIVAVNTTIDGAVLGDPQAAEGRGGISGAPLKPRAVAVLERLRARVGTRVPLISVGGIEGADDVWRRLRAGATLVQAYTGFVYGGPLWPRRVNRGLSKLLRDSGLASIAEAVGAGAQGAK